MLILRSRRLSGIIGCDTFINVFCRSMSRVVSGVSFVDKETAKNIDVELLAAGYLLPQLVELAGQAVAVAASEYGPGAALVLCGRGNNGADGLVAARHLCLYGREVHVWTSPGDIPDLNVQLLRQAEYCGVSVLSKLPQHVDSQYAVVVDALCGFGYRPPAREELLPALHLMADSSVPVCSVDVPSGWDVDKGDVSSREQGGGVRPDMLVSLSAPKLCALTAKASMKHVLGGRFIPQRLKQKLNLTLPEYSGTDLILRLAETSH